MPNNVLADPYTGSAISYARNTPSTIVNNIPSSTPIQLVVPDWAAAGLVDTSLRARLEMVRSMSWLGVLTLLLLCFAEKLFLHLRSPRIEGCTVNGLGQSSYKGIKLLLTPPDL
jgi:hypothetical protein